MTRRMETTEEWFALVEKVTPVSPNPDWAVETDGPYATRQQALAAVKRLRRRLVAEGLDPHYLRGSAEARITHPDMNVADGEETP